MVTLDFFLRDDLLPVRHAFPDDCEVVVGRADAAGVTVRGGGDRYEVGVGRPSLSEHHARLVVAGGRVAVEDLRSRNGTLVRLEPGTLHSVGDAAVGLGPDLVVRVADGRWQLPDDLDAWDAETLCRYVHARLAHRGACAALDASTPGAFPLVGETRHLVLRAPRDDRTVDLDDEAWVRTVVNAWNAARDVREGSVGWRFTAVSAARRRILRQAVRAAPTSLPVLLVGPTGAGKEVLAQDLHDHSPRARGPFVTVNCASLAPDRLESELFGHVRGAYTGAHADRAGLVEAAAGGTLLLDEVGDMAPEVQPKLLRFLESEAGEYRRMGEARVRHARVRVIAATNRDPAAPAMAASFRSDLYFRLAGIRIDVAPPGPEDLAAIAEEMLRAAAHERHAALDDADVRAVAALAAARPWPGGARELRQCVRRCVQMRRPNRPWTDDWQDAVAPGTTGSTGTAARPAPGVPAVSRAHAAPGVQPSAVGRLLSDAIFLTAARESGGRTALAARLQMTYQGTDSRLRALGVELGDAAVIDQRLAQCRRELRGHLGDAPWVRAILAGLLEEG